MSGAERVEVVGIGTELLLGQIANTNARWIGERLAEIGADVYYHQVVGDNLDRIVDVLEVAAARTDVVLVTGGLGPTEDDITREAIAAVMGVPLERDASLERWLRERFAGFADGPMPENNLCQADVPRGARTIENPRGSAPGLVANLPHDVRLYAMPGVPSEMIAMMQSTVLPELSASIGAAVVRSRTLRSVGIGESRVAELLADLFPSSSNPSIAYLASAGEVKVRLTAKSDSVEHAESMIEPLAIEVQRRLGDVVYTSHDETLEQVVTRLLSASGLRMACAESLTGGAVGARMTAAEGASDVFVGSAVTYTAQAKHRVLGVSLGTIEGPGVVSRECALEMAAGARRLFSSDVAVSLTGAAGPEPHDGAVRGTVWIGLDAEDASHARGYVAAGDRARVRRWAEQAALDLVRRHLEGMPLPESDRII
ncbi:MAG: competence/damage-inducible protein A [Actinomycetota bacterium]|nr:competence/damage-inducible protein A [Actinomycetota bacterium]MDH5225257.1 competence/damage-inducible protein A [Actinomycetota bacterium]MDH5312479.1 competence/damage-inducible protein A [Actinomycetota bacterium]